jgi:hypothetical protein
MEVVTFIFDGASGLLLRERDRREESARGTLVGRLERVRRVQTGAFVLGLEVARV